MDEAGHKEFVVDLPGPDDECFIASEDEDVSVKGLESEDEWFDAPSPEEPDKAENITDANQTVQQQSGADAIEDDDSDVKKIRTVIAFITLINYMNPDPILKYATEYNLFGYGKIKDIGEEKYTTDKNRRILTEVQKKGKTGYEKLKECLSKTEQVKLVELLECIERGEDTSNLLKQIHEETIHDMPQKMKELQDDLISLYMRSTLDQTSVPEIVLSKCKCVKDILEMSKILVFLSGFNVNVLSLISREMMKIVNEDEIALEYRSNLEWVSEPLEQFQDMCVSCCKELPDDNQVSLCLQDVFIGWSCQQEQYREHLKQMTTRNKQNIRSLYINMYGMKDTPYSSAREVIEYFGLNDLENIEKIHCDGKYNDGDILPLLNSSVQSLGLSCDSSLSRLLYEKLNSLQQLEAIGIQSFEMSHEQLTLLCDYISQRRCMRHIELGLLNCTDHRGSCTGGSVDLSQHSDLRTLTLGVIPVSQLHINMSAIEKCDLAYLSNADLVLRFVNCDPADSKVKSFQCRSLESPVAVDAWLQTLPQLWKVEDVRFGWINLGSRHVSLSPQMINIERVRLIDVAMSAGAARGLANSALTLPQPVVVDMWDCTITPREEFETLRAEMRNSPCFRLKDDRVNVKHKQ